MTAIQIAAMRDLMIIVHTFVADDDTTYISVVDRQTTDKQTSALQYEKKKK